MNAPSKSSNEGWTRGGQYSLRELLTIIFKRWIVISVTLLVVVFSVMFLTLRKPPLYKVISTLLVNEARAEMPMAPTDSGQLVVNRVSEEDLNSELEVLKSRSLIESVVHRLLNKDASDVATVPAHETLSVSSDSSRRPLREFNAVVVGFQSDLDVSVVRRTNVLRIVYRSTDPEWATRAVGTLTDEYLKQRAERYKSSETVSFFEQQMNEAEQRLIENNRVLAEFVENASITMVEGADGSDSLTAQKQLAMARLDELESALSEAVVEFESKSQEVASLRAMLASEPERLASSDPAHQNATTSEIERALAALQLERDRLLQDFKPESRHVRDIDSQIMMAEDRLGQAREASRVSGTAANPIYVQLKGELLRAEASLEGTRAEVASLTSQVEAYRNQREVENLNAMAFDLESLQRNSRTAEDDYLLYRKKFEEARISAAMDQEKFINVTVAQPAQMPLEAEPRGLALNLFLALFLGFLGAVLLAFGVEMYLDRSFTTAEELESRLGVPHIASIPDGEFAG